MFRMVLVLSLIVINSTYAATLHLDSGIKKNTLVELYTSEGCSSCPPAEEFLNNLKVEKGLWKKWVPVAFHVNYWDYIGWKDRYATKEFGHRQSSYASLKRTSTVYTPAFMVNGTSWRPGLFSKTIPDENPSAGNLVVSLDGNSIKANYQALKKYTFPLKLNVAVLGMGLTTQIERGENEGRKAKHEFVVVGFNSTSSNNLKWNAQLPELHYSGAKSYALAVWVSEINNPTPLQVVGGVLPGYKN